MKAQAILAVALLAATCFSPTHAQIPRTLSYQGVLTDSLGNPKPDANYNMAFRLYDSDVGGNLLYTSQKTIPTKRGLFTTLLGDQPPFSSSVRFDRPYWLSLEVLGSVLSPRVPLSSVAYSFNSAKADTASVAMLALDMTWRTSGSNIYRVNGNVGIGTTSPGAKLHVNGVEEGVRIQGTAAGASNSAYATFYDAAGTRTGYVGDGSTGDNDVFLHADLGNVTLNTSAGRVLTATSSGNVGIGTTAPLGGLHIKKEPIPAGGTLALEGTTHTYMSFFPDGVAAGRKGYLGFASATTSDIVIANEIPGGRILLASPTGVYAATGGEENLRIVRGVVDATGITFAGSGFQSSRTAEGRYSITFDTPFAGTPAVTATVQIAYFERIIMTELFNAEEVEFGTFRRDDGSYLDSSFSFVAIGPR